MTIYLKEVEPRIRESLINIISKKGIAYLEINFYRETTVLNQKLGINISSVELYKKVFKDLKPSLNSINQIFYEFQNEMFRPLFDESEVILKNWVTCFDNCQLVEKTERAYRLKTETCKSILAEYRSWISDFPEIKKSSLLEKTLQRELHLELDNEIIFHPKSDLLKLEILSQLQLENALQIKRKEFTIILKTDSNKRIVVKKVRTVNISPNILKNWFSNFGVKICLTTATYITEFGMPYCGDKIEMLQLCRFSLNNHGIVGILAAEIQFLIEKNGDEQFLLNHETHPLRQSALLALARLENYFNP